MNPVNPERRESTEREREGDKGDKRRRRPEIFKQTTSYLYSDSVLNPLKMWFIKLIIDFWKSKPTKTVHG